MHMCITCISLLHIPVDGEGGSVDGGPVDRGSADGARGPEMPDWYPEVKATMNKKEADSFVNETDTHQECAGIHVHVTVELV